MATSYGYGTCRSCGETRAARKDGKPMPHDVHVPGGTTWGTDRRLCPGCQHPMTDIKPPDCNGRSAHLTSTTPVTKRQPIR